MGSKNVYGIELHPKQLEIASGVINNTKKYNLIRCGRQFGKTILLEQLAFYYLLNFKKIKILFISPSFAQSIRVMKEMMDFLEGTGLVKKIDNKFYTIKFINGSEIIFKSTEASEKIRGFSGEVIIVDEFCFIKKSAWEDDIGPICNLEGRISFICSTPKGKDLFYQMHLLEKDYPNLYKSYHANYLDNPRADIEDIEIKRTTLPKFKFKNEYMAEFNLEDSPVFGNYRQCMTVKKFQDPMIGENYYSGLDIGKMADFTVVVILNSKKEVVYIHRENNKPYPELVKNCITVLNKYKVKNCYLETNGVGNPFYDIMYQSFKNITPVQLTNEIKVNLIENLIVEFENRTIFIPEFYSFLEDELSNFDYSYDGKTTRYQSKAGYHDDIIMALAYANQCYRDKNKVGGKIYGRYK